MNNLINEASHQLRISGKVICRIYQNNDYNDIYDITCTSFEDAYDLISHTYASLNDDIAILKS